MNITAYFQSIAEILLPFLSDGWKKICLDVDFTDDIVNFEIEVCTSDEKIYNLELDSFSVNSLIVIFRDLYRMNIEISGSPFLKAKLTICATGAFDCDFTYGED
ncbi:hypothetical protein [Desulfovibrio piger]|uniref:Uncharacterized protein n=1 Tax=Desulfovibrio piger TaxID=901 RepID=A0A848CJS1_9BACT|nr:hypothetical protein [Desulfovibrio piger]NME53119.1 hypothetical protein [Desulfovibrio piger]